jgi:hypothetical protein
VATCRKLVTGLFCKESLAGSSPAVAYFTANLRNQQYLLMPDSNLEKLAEVVTSIHGCDCSHLQTTKVHEMMDGKTAWQGEVEVFELDGHEKADKAFAWSYVADDGKRQYVAVLNIPPVISPREAVQAAIASGQLKR